MTVSILHVQFSELVSIHNTRIEVSKRATLRYSEKSTKHAKTQRTDSRLPSMPSLTLAPSSEQSPPPRTSPPKPPKLDTFDYRSAQPRSQLSQIPASPTAPEFSPITPPVKPAFPAIYVPPEEPQHPASTIDTSAHHADQPPQPPNDSVTSAAPPTDPAEYIPAPPPQPFSGEDATDAIALRAALSSLQFQKKKAQDDIRTLERLKKKAIDDPEHFKQELAAGRLKEERPKVGDLQAILDEDDSDGDDDEIVFGGSKQDGKEVRQNDSMDLDSSTPSDGKSPTSFDRIPGPQNVIRAPYINWDKYHITGAPLDQLHEQQRKWPGQPAFGHERRREYAVAAPYSPWLDTLDTQTSQGQQRWERNDSGSVMMPMSGLTPSGLISEHPMETRRRTNG